MKTLWKLIAPLAMAALQASGAVVLNPFDPNTSGIYNNYTDDLLPGYSLNSAQLPLLGGVVGIKTWGSATMGREGESMPSFYLKANGTASGTFIADTALDTALKFTLTFADPQGGGVLWYANAGVSTSVGDYYTEFSGYAQNGVSVEVSSPLNALYPNSASVPAGATLLSWFLYLGVGDYGNPFGPDHVTLTIPQNSFDLRAVGVSPPSKPDDSPAPAPEPATLLMVGATLVAIGVRVRAPKRVQRNPETALRMR